MTDYSPFDDDRYEEDGRTDVPAPTAPDTFGGARAVTYVLERDVRGGMGPALVPFDEAEARSFVGTHGGRPVPFDDSTPELVAGDTRR